jgi:ABC-type anion transport system duplicated permease subunit
MTSKATIYISDPWMIGTKLFDQFEEILEVKPINQGNQAVGMLFNLGFSQVQINFMSPDDLPNHLAGLKGYVESTYNGCNEDLLYIQARIKAITFAMGMVISPSFEEDDSVLNFLYKFNDRLNGLLFIFDSVVDYDGTPLVGPLVELVSEG